MGKVLVIAEKPSVGNDIAKALGATDRQDGYIENESYIITWAIGHLIGLKYPEEHNPDFKEWKLEDLPFSFPLSESLKVLPDSQKQFNVVKKLIARDDVEYLVNAGDAGREGLLIQEWIYRMAGNRKPVKMLWISSFTEDAVRKAFASGLKERAPFMGLLNEAEARAEGDNFLGINYSRLLTLTRAGAGTSLSYGRCQTPLLNIVVQREYEIARFKPEPYYNIEISYQDGFKGILVDEEHKRIDFKDKADAERLLGSLASQGTVVTSTKEDKSKKPPLLYNLAALQKTMGSRYGYTPDKTLQIAQSLYEKHKILSYPRTDSQCLSSDLFAEITEHLDSCNFGKFKPYVEKISQDNITPEKRFFNDLKVTDHHALIPTINGEMGDIYEKLSEEEKNVFDAVVTSFIAIFYPDYLYSVTEIVVEVNGNSFYSKGTTVRSQGYKEVLKMEPGESDAADQKEEAQSIPLLQENQEVILSGKQLLDKMTKPPARYSISSLIAVMEKYNIGTSATRAEIIKKLENPRREFIHMEKNKYYATELGRKFIEIIPPELKDVKLTESFEEKLKQINEGALAKEDFLKELEDEFQKNMEKFTDGEQEKLNYSREEIICPKCKKGNLRMGDKNVYCTGYKDGCDFGIWKMVAGKKLTDKQLSDLITKGQTGKIAGFKSKAGKAFSAALVLDKEFSVEFKFK